MKKRKPQKASAVRIFVFVKLIHKSRIICFSVKHTVEDDLLFIFGHLVEHKIFFNHDHTKSEL